MKHLIEKLKNLSERQKALPALAQGFDGEKPARKGGFKVSSKVLKMWKQAGDAAPETPKDFMFPKVLKYIDDIPRNDLPKIWGADNMADAQDIVSGKPKKAFQMWMRNVKVVAPKIHGVLKKVPANAPLVYYAFMSRVVGDMMADQIFKRYFETDGGYFVKKK